jgi:transposase InsO family protein
MKDQHPVCSLCEALEVSTSGYYDWLNRKSNPGPRAIENDLLSEQITIIHKESRETYGSPRIQQKLSQAGRSHGRERIARLMRRQGLCGRAKCRFRVRTTDSNHDQPIAPNRMAQMPAPSAPNGIWVGDITYIDTEQGWLYLAGVMDMYSRRIVGWAMGENIDTKLILSAWNMALTRRQPADRLVFHSDRGCQYASADFRRALEQGHAIPSMSGKACCYDNAAMESFWSTLKQELVYRRHFNTREEARVAIFDFIETFYNRTRIHSSLNFQSPLDFENNNH